MSTAAATPTLTPQATAAPLPLPGDDGRTYYGASGGRKTVLSFLFLLLLPFFISLPGMFMMRWNNGLMQDNFGFLVMAFAFTALIVFVLIELMKSLRLRVELGPDSVKMNLPKSSGPTPKFRYQAYDIPYDQIHAVETRREIYGGSLAPVLLKGARLITKDQQTIALGYVSDANVDPSFPYPEIAKKIADRARLPLIDRGNVRRSVHRKLFGIKSATDDAATIVDEAAIANLNRNHRNVVLALILGMVGMLAVGLVDDLSEERQLVRSETTITEQPPTVKTEPAKKDVPPKKKTN
jgi:hypothetical protein